MLGVQAQAEIRLEVSRLYLPQDDWSVSHRVNGWICVIMQTRCTNA